MANEIPLKSRIVVHEGTFDGSRFTDQNSLAKALMDKPDQLTPVLTMLFGSWNNYFDRFPLLSLTEGQKKGTSSVEVNNIEYEYPVIGKRKTTEVVVGSSYSSSDKPGVGHSAIILDFASDWIPRQQMIQSPNGTSARVMEVERISGDKYRYTLRLFNPNPAGYLDPSQTVKGTVWGIVGGAPVSQSMSVGNYGGSQSPGKRKNQISVLRQSYRLAGNISNKVVEFRLFDANGNATNLWIDWYEFQQMLRWRIAKHEHMWLSEYTRDAYGNNPLIDPDTGQIIPTGAGLKQQIPNETTYTVLTEKLIRTIIGDVFRGTPDTNMMDIVLYTGDGGFEEFDYAMKDSKIFNLVAQGTGQTDHFVRSMGGNLQLGGYFTSYKHVDGQTVTIKKLKFLDESGYADKSPRHPVTGLPLSSYEMYFVDHSIYDGVPNVQAVYEKGRMEIRGLEQGMSLVKGQNYGDYSGNSKFLNLSTEQDASAIHFLCTTGVQMLRDTHSFKLTPGSDLVSLGE